MKIGIIGECMIEISGVPFSGDLIQSYGGDTLNTAIYLSRLLPSANINYVTAVGEDLISKRLIQIWQKEGVSTDFVTTVTGYGPGLYWIILDDLGERNFMYWRKNSAATQWLKQEHQLKELMNMDWIYLSGISLAILDQDDRDKLLLWLKKYRDQGGKIAFDSNYRESLWEDAFEAQENYRRILEITELALLTDTDEMQAWNISVDELEAHIKSIHCPLILLKQGAKGALIHHGNNKWFVVAKHVNKVIDSTAAGDSFNAGMLAGLIQGKTVVEACELGHELASTVIQYKGAIIPVSSMSYLMP